MGSRQIPQLPQVVFHAQKQLGNLEIQVFRSTSSVYCDSEASEVCRKLFWQVKLLACHFATPLELCNTVNSSTILFSSVTAGHDSFFNDSTPVVVGTLMKSSFQAMDIDFESRNVALGNNPCVPYDVCIKYFAGLDADIVHWEQNYFCDGRSAMETFVRQAMTIPTKPVVVFSESNTGHWQEDQCKNGPHVLTAAEKKLLGMTPIELVSEGNKDEYHRAVSTLL